MTDPRLTPDNGRVAHISLQGKVSPRRFTEGRMQQVSAPISDLLRSPDGGLDRQLLRGAAFLLLDDSAVEGFVFGQSVLDGYVGYLRAEHLQDPEEPTHRLTSPASHTYPKPDIKTRPLCNLSFGSLVTVTGEDGDFLTLADGSFMPHQHLTPVETPVPDPMRCFESLLGVPYLWGGNSVWGIDCSGAVQLVLEAANQKSERDADMQEARLGRHLPPDAPLQRRDLVFWKGHVGMMRDAETLIHANVYHMAVASEPLSVAVARIQKNGGGPVTSRKRP